MERVSPLARSAPYHQQRSQTCQKRLSRTVALGPCNTGREFLESSNTTSKRLSMLYSLTNSKGKKNLGNSFD